MVKIGLISAGLLSAFLIAWLHSPWLQQQNLSVATNEFEKINLKYFWHARKKDNVIFLFQLMPFVFFKILNVVLFL